MRTGSLSFLLLVATATSAASPQQQPRHKVKPGESFESIARTRYGSRHYGPLLAELNGVKTPTPKPGATLEVAPLEEGVASLALPKELEGLLRHFARAGSVLAAIDVDLKPLRPAKGTAIAKLPTPLLVRIQNAEAAVNLGRSATEAVREKHEPPPRALDALDKAAAAAKALREGKLDAKGEDVQVIHQHLAAAMLEVVRWYRAGYR